MIRPSSLSMRPAWVQVRDTFTALATHFHYCQDSRHGDLQRPESLGVYLLSFQPLSKIEATPLEFAL